MRYFKYISIVILVLLMLVLGTAYAVFTSNNFQNWLTGKVSNYLSAQFKTKISIGHISYKPLRRLEMQEVLFGDHKSDTLFYAGRLSFNITGFHLDSVSFRLNDVKVQDGLCNLAYYKDRSFNIDVLYNALNSSDSSGGPPFRLFFDEVQVENTRFKYTDETDSSSSGDFNPSRQYFYGISAKCRNFSIIDDSLSFILDDLKMKEVSGFEATHMHGHVILSSTCMIFDSMQLKTPYSTLGDYYSMHYNNWGSFGNFYDDIKLNGRLNNAQIDFRDLGFFAPELKKYKYKLRAQGSGKGTVSNMKLKNLDIRFGQTGVFRGKADLNGLPDIENTFIDAEATQVIADHHDLEYLAGLPIGKEIASLGLIQFKGRYTGFYKDFVAYGSFNTALGKVESDINMKLAGESDAYEYSGNISLIDFDLGQLSGQAMLGKTSTDASVQGKGLVFESMITTVNAEMPYMDFNGYRYKNIDLNGTLDRKVISAELKVDEENIRLAFNGDINLHEEIPEYTFKARIDHAHMKPLGFDTADRVLNADADINFAWKDLDHNSGTISLDNINITEGEELYEVKSIRLTSVNQSGYRDLTVKTDQISARIKGTFNFHDLPDAFKAAVSQLVPGYFPEYAAIKTTPQQLTFDADIKTLYPFNRLYFPGIRLHNATISSRFDPTAKQWFVNAKMAEARYKKFRFIGVDLDHRKSQENKASLYTEIRQFSIGDTLYAQDIMVSVMQEQNRAEAELKIRDSLSLFTTNTKGVFSFYEDSISGVFSTSSLGYQGSRFSLKEKSRIAFTPHGISFSEVFISRNENETLLLNGIYGIHAPHSLRADVQQVHLDLLNEILPDLSMKANGSVSGNLSLGTKDDHWILGADMFLSDVSLDHDTLGDFRMISNYADNQDRVMAVVKSVKGKLRNLQVGGFYDLAHKNDALNFTISFDESDVTTFQAFVKDYIRLYSGNVRANGQLTGSLRYPELNCDVDLMGVTVMVEYLKTMYSFSSTVHINEQLISINPTEVRDINDKRAMLSGSIHHRNFSNFSSNLKLTGLNGFQVLNTGIKDNDLFYGTAYVDGGLSLSGPFGDLVLDARFTAQRGTLISIPLSSDYTESEDGLIHFVNKDTTIGSDKTKRSGSISGFTINCMLHTTKNAEIQIVLDEQQGDKIRGRGEGDLKLELTRSGQFNMYGEVEIEEGDYRFTAMNLFTKKFILKKGGTITWTGDPFAGQMNITGSYLVRTSVADIVSAASAEERQVLAQQRIPVECLMYLKGNLLAPDIKFDMNITDINGALSGNAASELQNILRMWRNENEMMTQQVISLMLFGRFTPTNLQNSTGPTNLTAGVNNTLSGFVSAQATNFIQQLIPGLDVNVDYHTGNETVRGRTILSASKRVLDNRLEFQASIDPVNTYQNFLTQYNLTRDGNLKAKAFSRAQPDPIYNRNITTGGLGLYYRKEFDKLGDLFVFKKKIVSTPNQ